MLSKHNRAQGRRNGCPCQQCKTGLPNGETQSIHRSREHVGVCNLLSQHRGRWSVTAEKGPSIQIRVEFADETKSEAFAVGQGSTQKSTSMRCHSVVVYFLLDQFSTNAATTRLCVMVVKGICKVVRQSVQIDEVLACTGIHKNDVSSLRTSENVLVM